MPPNCSRPDPLCETRAVRGLLGDDDPGPDGDHDRRVPEREEIPGADRLLPLVHQLAGRVVDGRDVVGVEGVTQPQGVGEHGDADTEALVVPGDHKGDEHAEAHDVEQERCWRTSSASVATACDPSTPGAWPIFLEDETGNVSLRVVICRIPPSVSSRL